MCLLLYLNKFKVVVNIAVSEACAGEQINKENVSMITDSLM